MARAEKDDALRGIGGEQREVKLERVHSRLNAIRVERPQLLRISLRFSQAVIAISICEDGCSTADRNRASLARRDVQFLQRSDATLHEFSKVHALQSNLAGVAACEI
jgi:DICT domain-containing protein